MASTDLNPPLLQSLAPALNSGLPISAIPSKVKANVRQQLPHSLSLLLLHYPPSSRDGIPLRFWHPLIAELLDFLVRKRWGIAIACASPLSQLPSLLQSPQLSSNSIQQETLIVQVTGEGVNTTESNQPIRDRKSSIPIDTFLDSHSNLLLSEPIKLTNKALLENNFHASITHQFSNSHSVVPISSKSTTSCVEQAELNCNRSSRDNNKEEDHDDEPFYPSPLTSDTTCSEPSILHQSSNPLSKPTDKDSTVDLDHLVKQCVQRILDHDVETVLSLLGYPHLFAQECMKILDEAACVRTNQEV